MYGKTLVVTLLAWATWFQTEQFGNNGDAFAMPMGAYHGDRFLRQKIVTDPLSIKRCLLLRKTARKCPCSWLPACVFHLGQIRPRGPAALGLSASVASI